ncbi:hypothetical protein OTU49_016259, partial [Cherax quadricarinatus]
EKCQGEVGSSAEHGNEENSGDSDVVALPSEDGADTNCLSGESEASGKEVTGSVGSQQIFSNVESSSQGFNDNEQACSTETMEDINKNMMPCPLCQKLFSIEQIEVHASDCSEGPEEPQKLSKEAGRKGKRRQNQRGQVAEDVEIEQATINTKLSDVSKSDKTQTPAGHERCTFCKKVFKEGDDYLIHVQSCKHMEDIRESIGSPVTSRTPGIKSAKPGGDAHNPNLVMGRLRRNIRTESLFDHLEEKLLQKWNMKKCIVKIYGKHWN